MKLKIEDKPTDRLVPYAMNSRTHSDKQVEQIAKSIQEFGFVNPVLVRADLSIIAGHGRVMAAKLLGMKHVPVIVLDHLSERQARALVLADNKIAMNAGWDFEKLSAEMNLLVDLEFDVTSLGFDEQELDALLKGGEGIFPDEVDSLSSVQPVAEFEVTNRKSKSKIVHKCPSCGETFSS